MTIAIPAWILWVFYAIGITSLIVFACVGIYVIWHVKDWNFWQ